MGPEDEVPKTPEQIRIEKIEEMMLGGYEERAESVSDAYNKILYDNPPPLSDEENRRRRRFFRLHGKYES
jgi:hypothetical protein